MRAYCWQPDRSTASTGSRHRSALLRRRLSIHAPQLPFRPRSFFDIQLRPQGETAGGMLRASLQVALRLRGSFRHLDEMGNGLPHHVAYPSTHDLDRHWPKIPSRYAARLVPMPDKATEVHFTEITDHITGNTGSSVGFGRHAGITSAPKSRLFDEHGVGKDTGKWIWRKAGNDRHARRIEQRLLRWGCAGGSGGRDDASLLSYAYEITRYSDEDAYGSS